MARTRPHRRVVGCRSGAPFGDGSPAQPVALGQGPVPRRPAQVPLRSGPSLRLARCLRPHHQYYIPIRHPVSARPTASAIPCHWPPPATLPEAPTGLPRFRHVPFVREMALDPGRAAAPRIPAPFMLPSPQRTGSTSATSVISWLNPIPHTIAVYASAPPLPVGPATLATRRLATPYPGGTFTRWTAPASPGAPVAPQTPRLRRKLRARHGGLPSVRFTGLLLIDTVALPPVKPGRL